MRNETNTGIFEALESRLLLGGDPFPDLGLLEDPNNPVVRMLTDRGPIFIELLQNEAPNTVLEFLERFDDGAIGQTFFHSLVPGVTLEGGTWMFLEDVDGNNFYETEVLTTSGIRLDDPTEGGRPNTERTIAAVWRPEPPSPGAGFPSHMVFNLTDNSGTHAADQFVVFARVLDDASWSVVQDIASLPVGDFTGAPNAHIFSASHLTNVPLDMPYTDGQAVSPDIVVQSADLMVMRQGGAPDYYRHTLYSAEGFTGSTISEFIPMVNPNAEDAYFEVRVRYERFEGPLGFLRDDLVHRGVIAANSRGGVTISTPDNWGEAAVIHNKPYAIEIWSTLPLAANLSHYDFGIATGEAFVSTLDTSWFIGDVTKNNSDHDFVLWYNPSAQRATVTLTFIVEDGSVAPLTFVVEPFRRAGINFQAHAEIPGGFYSVLVESDVPILASISHYGVTALAPPKDGWGAIGQSGAPSTFGIVPIAYERGGINASPLPDLGFVFYNPGATEADVSIDFYAPGSATPLLTLTDVAILPAGERRRVLLETVDLPDVPTLIAVIRSTQAIFSSEWSLRVEDSYSAGVGVTASTEHHFAEGFTDPSRTAPNSLEESLTVFNPFAAAFGADDHTATVTFTFRYTDGTSFSIERSVDGGTGLNLHISSLQEVIDQAEQHDRSFYSIQVTSDVPILAQYLHTDTSLGTQFGAGGGFSSFGTTFGPRTRLDDLGDV